ncbi:Uncharacterised protein [BD1-7 clade bacterium]|uniref:Uncharacterized protein n=1 Tax=BD1-7 clade bacterium TaxID=2029982 RepID=A0A5S9NWC6_9GAMM|nr:Uncharacterised protein [BD1-7 clade bacterium]CAA0110225.1 Uncharacterised protein [BD1-7 clade bacterium]
MARILSVTLIFLCGYVCAHGQPIGYIGFANNGKWAVQFNDCAVISFEGAQQYLWFDRTLNKISCYSFKESDISPIRNTAIRIHSKPDHSSSYKSVMKFGELNVSGSGWGAFPKVYERAGLDWYRVAEGWIQLNRSDKVLVDYYVGSQDISGKRTHDEYFDTH